MSNYAIGAIKLCLDVGNDDYIIFWNFGGHVMSGFKVIEGGVIFYTPLMYKTPPLGPLKLNKRPERLLDHLGACKKGQNDSQARSALNAWA